MSSRTEKSMTLQRPFFLSTTTKSDLQASITRFDNLHSLKYCLPLAHANYLLHQYYTS